MPWHIEQDNPDCNGWAVVKDSDGSVAGCHESEGEAQAQMAALYASETEGRMERRSYELQRVAIRRDGDGATISGYAAMFNRMSVPLYGFREVIAPGAFGGSLREDVRALWQHNSDQVLGRTRARTLTLWEDEQGLAFELHPPDTTIGRDAVTSIERGDVDQMSFGFTVREDGEEWSEEDDGLVVRTLTDVRLIEISPVTFPAYPDTAVAVNRSADDVVRSAPTWVQRALAQGADSIADDEARARYDLRKRQLTVDILRAGGN